MVITVTKKRKETVKVFKEEGLKISCETNISRVCFLDVLFDLDQDCYKPYHKINSQVRYVDKGSNHPDIILQNIPYGINKRLSSISSNEECFNEQKDTYQQAINAAGYSYNSSYQ